MRKDDLKELQARKQKMYDNMAKPRAPAMTSEDIAKQIAEFQKNGGTIQQIPTGMTRDGDDTYKFSIDAHKERARGKDHVKKTREEAKVRSKLMNKGFQNNHLFTKG